MIAGKRRYWKHEATLSFTERRAGVSHRRREVHRALGINGRDAASQLRIASGQPLPVHSPSPAPYPAYVLTHADVRIGQAVKSTRPVICIMSSIRHGVWIVGEVLGIGCATHWTENQPVAARLRGVIRQAIRRRDRPCAAEDGSVANTRRAVVIVVDNRERLADGRACSGVLPSTVRVAKESIVCPADAIMQGAAPGRYVLVQRKPGKYENRQVKLGLAKGKQVEVLDGALSRRQGRCYRGAFPISPRCSVTSTKLVCHDGTEKTDAGEATTPAAVDYRGRRDRRVADRSAGLCGCTTGRRTRTPHPRRTQPTSGKPERFLPKSIAWNLRTVQLDLLQSCSRLRLAEQTLVSSRTTTAIKAISRRSGGYGNSKSAADTASSTTSEASSGNSTSFGFNSQEQVARAWSESSLPRGRTPKQSLLAGRAHPCTGSRMDRRVQRRSWTGRSS